MPEISLPGCTPEPLRNYLKALGVFRLVGEQKDPSVRGYWGRDGFRLLTCLSSQELEQFFLEEYRPTPIVAPWNGGSGFYKSGQEILEAIARSTTPRLVLYRQTIERIRQHCNLPPNKPKDSEKLRLLQRCRAELPDEVVPWLDVCFVLTEDEPEYFPLLGTGGNDGRLDFTNNFMQRLAEVLPLQERDRPPALSAEWLHLALFAKGWVQLVKAAIGQFDPGGAGGANAVQGKFEAESFVNPWDFVLMIEGTLLLAGAVARRLGVQSGRRAAFPFTVEAVAVGYASAVFEEAFEAARAELWLPLWDRSAGLLEVRQLFAEGRAQLGRRQARNAVEFALAACLLGVNRGIRSFVRYGFLKRFGKNYLAAPLGYLAVTPRPAARLLDDPALTTWLERFRSVCRGTSKKKAPARYVVALQEIDRAIFDFTNRSEQGNDAPHLLRVLRALGRAERALASGLGFCKENNLPPLQGLNPQWRKQADDGSAEFRLAASLAGLRSPGLFPSLRVFLENVEIQQRVRWSDQAESPRVVWSQRALAENLAAIFRRRMIEAVQRDRLEAPLLSPRPARLGDVIAFLTGQTDDDKLADLIWGLAALDGSDWSGLPPEADPQHEGDGAADHYLPVEYSLLRLLAEPALLEAEAGRWRYRRPNPDEQPTIRLEPQLFFLNGAAGSEAVWERVWRAALRLRAAGLTVVGYRNRYQAGKPLGITITVSPRRLLAALLFPLPEPVLEHLANTVLHPPAEEEV
jgi:CRISPR-associated protein Csx17